MIAAFGVAMLFFRVQREISMRDHNERNWIPWADWLLTRSREITVATTQPRALLDGVARRDQADPAGNINPDKSKSRDRIDGIVALVMAAGREMVYREAGVGVWAIDW